LRKIPSGDFEKFLRLVDEELAEPFTIIKLSFLALLARLFGEEEAKRVDREIR